MSDRQNFWRKMTGRQKGVIGGAVALVLVVALVGVTAWVWPDGSNSVQVPAGNTESTKPAADPNSDAAAPSTNDEAVLSVRGSRDATGMKFKVGDDGMIVLPETDDPVEFAAAAVSAMHTFDTKKMPWHQPWMEELISRLAQPSPNFTGAKMLSGTTEGEPMATQETLSITLPRAKYWELQTSDDYNPWLSSEAAWVAQPYELWVNEEIGAINPKTSKKLKDLHEKIAATGVLNGGSLTNVWVTVDVQHRHGDGNVDEIEHRATMGVLVYCDPPESGGLCGLYSHARPPKELAFVRY